MSSFALNSENLTVDTFSPLPGNASFLRRGRSGIVRVKLVTTELVKSLRVNAELVNPSLLQRTEPIFPLQGLRGALNVMPQAEGQMFLWLFPFS